MEYDFFSVIEIDTTGHILGKDRITAFAVVKLNKKLEIVGRLHEDEVDISNKSTFIELRKFLSNTCVVANKGKRFTFPMLNYHFKTNYLSELNIFYLQDIEELMKEKNSQEKDFSNENLCRLSGVSYDETDAIYHRATSFSKAFSNYLFPLLKNE